MEEIIYQKFIEMLREDMPFWDVTTEILVPEKTKVRAVVIAKQEGVIACVDYAADILERFGLSVVKKLRDGDVVKGGDVVLEIVGDARKILSLERTLLNLLMHCSGVATSVRRMVEKARAVNPRIRVAATRKTIPLLRIFEKKAVVAGGGDTHRFSLSDAVLIKDNHLKIVGDVAEAVRRAKESAGFMHKVEVEVSNVEDAVKAVEAGADVVMFDNMSPEEIASAVKELEKRGLRNRVILEASGGITLENVDKYASTGVDVVSCGWVTMSSKALDMSLEVVEVLPK